MTKTAAKWTAVAVLVLIAMRTLPSGNAPSAFNHWIAGLGIWGALAFALIYIIATVCLFPGSLLTLAGGAIFGLWYGFAVVSAASTTGAALAFLIARYVARTRVTEMAESSAMFAALDEAISEGGWRIVALLRMSPIIPFTWQNYLYGLTRIEFWPYVLASWIAMMPGTFMYVYLGTLAGASSTGEARSVWQWGLLILGLLATIIVTVYIARLAREKLAEKMKLQEPIAFKRAPNNAE